MNHIKQPSLILLTLIVGLPQFSETVYTPALPDIAKALVTSDAFVEYTLTIYLLGFALGTLFWGRLSDRYGRKPCLLVGLFTYLLGCIGCFFSVSITHLMISRFIQAFGGSTGSVLGQAICRDAFKGTAQGKAYSTITSALSFAPAFGPLIGGLFDQTFGWHSIFGLLIALAVFMIFFVFNHLSETHNPRLSTSQPLATILRRMCKDINVLILGTIVAICNGINFSYFAEGPFVLITLLRLSPAQYGISFAGIAFAGMLGGYISRKMHNYTTSYFILKKGVAIIAIGSTFFMIVIAISQFFSTKTMYGIVGTLVSMMFITVGISMVTSNALALALKNYKEGIGTASALLGFFYYSLISFFTFLMGIFHNGTLLPMPLYFWILSSVMYILWFLLPAEPIESK